MRVDTNFLAEIIERKSAQVPRAKEAVPLSELTERARAVRKDAKPFALRAAIGARKSGLAVIAEFKRASPSQGGIRPEAAAAEIARTFEQNGAAAVSVLTEEHYFHGSLEDLKAVKAAVRIPVLRKDFIVDEYQVFESAAAGADALLLIVAALNDEQLVSLRRLAEDELQMDTLVEVHTVDEMQRAVACGARLIGVNNRDLRTFVVSLEVSEECLASAPVDAILISESGLRENADLRRLRAAGFHGFLIGETLMRAEDPGEALRALLGKAVVRIKICGITNLEDALACADAGANLLGFNFYSGSPRYIEPEAARKIIGQLPGAILTVGVFVDAGEPEEVARLADAAGVAAVQLHGNESPSYCRELDGRFVIKALRANEGFKPESAAEYKTDAVLLDAFDQSLRGGTGKTFDWSIARSTKTKVPKLILAGGLGPENVAEAVASVQPYAVDACSSLESSPGRKDIARVRAFIAAIRGESPSQEKN